MVRVYKNGELVERRKNNEIVWSREQELADAAAKGAQAAMESMEKGETPEQAAERARDKMREEV